MFTVKELPHQIDADLISLLVQAEPAVIGHFLHTGFMGPQMRPLFSDRRISGTAITVRVPGMDGTMVHHAIGQARKGDVIVMDRCNDMVIASLGGATAYAARKIGVAGIIVDGLVTDLGELRQYGVPVWFKGTSAITVKSLGLGGDFCTPVTCGGVTVNPGDAILADENGILVLPPQQIKAAAERAIQMSKDERKTLERLDAGEKYPDILGTTTILEQALARQRAA